MEQMQATFRQHGSNPNPLDTTGLCLLSLDGGGVRGLSTLYILKSIMDRLNHGRKKDSLPPVKPCEVFDLIGGTSTGGLIAIMLGRLEMSVDECIAAYSTLAEAVFSKKSSRIPVNIKGDVKSRFDSRKLESAIKTVIAGSGASERDLLNDETERGCRTFVCSIDRDTKDMVHLRSYSLADELSIPATICEAALATSAASTFFDPVSIGDRTFADGAFGANNPVDEVEGEAINIWCSELRELKPLVKCFVSIGTGNPGKKAFENSMFKFLGETVVKIATETEMTEKKFVARWANQYHEKRYFRFNVEQGLQDIGLEEYNKKGAIQAASEGYLSHTIQKLRVGDCIQNLRLKQSTATTNLSYLINEYNVQRMIELHAEPRTEALWIVPFQRNPQFVGRSAEIAQVGAMLSSTTRCEKVAIMGLGGVGKTQIALEFSHQLRERQLDCSVFWIPVMNSESMREAYLEIAQQLQIPDLEQNKEDVQNLVHRRLSQDNSGRWLLIFDNADNIDIWTDKAAKTGSRRRIDDLPKSKHGSILFTTRSRKVATKLAGKNVVLVREMDKSMAKDLLKNSLANLDILADSGTAVDLLQKLTFLPLAIVQAAAYINENGITLGQYAALLDGTEENKIDLLSEEFEDEGRYADTKNPVATTWLISFEQIRSRDLLAAEYLSFMSCIDAKDIPQSLLPPAESVKKALEAIGMLTAYSFVTKHKTDQLLDLHRLVHLATRNWLQMEGSLGEWTSKALERLEEVFPGNDHTNRSMWRMYLPHARYALKSKFESAGAEKTVLLLKFGNCTYSDGRYKEAEKAFMQVVETYKEELGADHPAILTSMSNLASTYWKQGQWKAAKELFMQVIETDTQELGADHPDTLIGLSNLASIYRDQGQWKAAEELDIQVMKTRKEKLGVDHPDTLTSMGNLASTYWKQGRWKAAEELDVQVMKTTKERLGADHPDTLISMSNLALTYQDQGRWNDAEQLLVQVIKTHKETLGADHPDTLQSMGNLASIYCSQGRWNDAEQLKVQVMETYKEKLGPDHPETLASMANLAINWKKQGRGTEAISLMRECVRLSQRILGLEHPDFISSLRTLVAWETLKRF